MLLLRTVFALLAVCCSYLCYSQDLYKLPAHTNVQNVTWWDSIYRFPSFEPGRITLATRYSPDEEVRFNYNLYYMQMDYIASNGDTLQIKPSREIKLITIGAHQFYHHYRIGYLEILLQKSISLGVLNFLNTEDTRIESGNKVLSYDKVDARGGPSNYDRYYRKFAKYYFLDLQNEPYKASKHAILKLFNNHRKPIKAYIAQHNVAFNNKQNLIMLLNFCNQLVEVSRP